jgi:hypothetical protein
LQKLMLRSYSNTLVSVRRVTQDNKGNCWPHRRGTTARGAWELRDDTLRAPRATGLLSR